MAAGNELGILADATFLHEVKRQVQNNFSTKLDWLPSQDESNASSIFNAFTRATLLSALASVGDLIVANSYVWT